MGGVILLGDGALLSLAGIQDNRLNIVLPHSSYWARKFLSKISNQLLVPGLTYIQNLTILI